MVRIFMLVIDSSIDEKVKLREDFDISAEGKELHSLKIIRRRDKIPIIAMTDEIFHRDLKKDESSRKREVFSNDNYNIKRHKNTLKEILKEDRKDRNRAEFGLEDRICTLIQLYHIKRES